MIGWPRLEVTPTWGVRNRKQARHARWVEFAKSLLKTLEIILFIGAMFYLASVWMVVVQGPTGETAKFEPATTWDERHSQGWAEWGNSYLDNPYRR